MLFFSELFRSSIIADDAENCDRHVIAALSNGNVVAIDRNTHHRHLFRPPTAALNYAVAVAADQQIGYVFITNVGINGSYSSNTIWRMDFKRNTSSVVIRTLGRGEFMLTF